MMPLQDPDAVGSLIQAFVMLTLSGSSLRLTLK